MPNEEAGCVDPATGLIDSVVRFHSVNDRIDWLTQSVTDNLSVSVTDLGAGSDQSSVAGSFS